jgi:hypothetical protein
MLTFNLEHGEQVQIDRTAVEEKILLSIFDKLEQAREADKGLYTILKQAVNMVLTFSKVDIKIPKGENSLEYLLAYYVGLGLDVMEQKPLEVSGVVVNTTKEAVPNAETN